MSIRPWLEQTKAYPTAFLHDTETVSWPMYRHIDKKDNQVTMKDAAPRRSAELRHRAPSLVEAAARATMVILEYKMNSISR